jgi:uncharacterized protein YmfQ (DUF2313 family)
MPDLPRTYILVGRPSAEDLLVTALDGAYIYLRSQLAKEPPVFEYDLDDYAAQFVNLLPRGPAWDAVDTGLLRDLIYAIVTEFKRISDKICILENETFPLNTTQLLTDWERALGLPDDCSADIAQSRSERRAAVAARLATIAEPTPAFFVLLAADFGYSIEVSEHFPARVGRARVGDRIHGPGNEFTWSVLIPGNYTQSRQALVGDAQVGDRIATWGDGSLECLIRQYKPAHTTLHFQYEA